MATPYIPEYITVHLGPPNSNAANYTLPFVDYIKNVASGEIYPTWPENAIRANIYAQITFALNRIFTEHYRSRGYDFDITSSTAYDQFFDPNHEIFENISDIVDDIFNSYVQKQGTVGPYFTQYCDGRQVQCKGLSQWGTVPLANQGLTPYEILQRYYGQDIDIVQNAPIRPNVESYSGTPLSRGSSGTAVWQIQSRLNRISANYPSIPKINPTDGFYSVQTEDAVKEFQRIFNLEQDGIVGRATWYKIIFVYNAVKKLSELDSEGISVSEFSRQYKETLSLGDTGSAVKMIQFFLSAVSNYYPTVPTVPVDGVFGEQTRNAVIAFQNEFGLTPDGIVGEQTWNALNDAYLGFVNSNTLSGGGTQFYQGQTLEIGSRGDAVTTIQRYLSVISDSLPEIPKTPVTGYYGQQTENAVLKFQEIFGLPQTGAVGPYTWNQIASTYSDIAVGSERQAGQQSGYTVSQ